jgi:hypothetical protein
VTRGTRPKKPSSSRGFAREARGTRGAWGSWGLKIENRIFFFSFQDGNNYKRKRFLFLFLFFCADSRLCPQGGGEAREGGGEGGENRVRPLDAGVRLCGRAVSARTLGCVRANASVLPLCNIITDAVVHPSHGRPSGHRPTVRPSAIVRLSTLLTSWSSRERFQTDGRTDDRTMAAGASVTWTHCSVFFEVTWGKTRCVRADTSASARTLKLNFFNFFFW